MGVSRRDIRMTMATAALKRTSFNKLFDEIGTVDQVGIEERVAKFTTRSIKKGSKLWGPFTRSALEPYKPTYFLDDIKELPPLLDRITATSAG